MPPRTRSPESLRAMEAADEARRLEERMTRMQSPPGRRSVLRRTTSPALPEGSSSQKPNNVPSPTPVPVGAAAEKPPNTTTSSLFRIDEDLEDSPISRVIITQLNPDQRERSRNDIDENDNSGAGVTREPSLSEDPPNPAPCPQDIEMDIDGDHHDLPYSPSGNISNGRNPNSDLVFLCFCFQGAKLIRFSLIALNIAAAISSLTRNVQAMNKNFTHIDGRLNELIDVNKGILARFNTSDAMYDGDIEMSTLPNASSPLRKRTKTIKLHNGRNPRPATLNEMHVRARLLILELLKCQEDGLPPPPTPEELNDLAAGNNAGPTTEYFRIEYLNQKIHHSAWNQRLWVIFMHRFDETWGHLYGSNEDKDRISQWFWGHIKYLADKYYKQTFATPLQIAAARSQAARDTRRRKLFNERLTACDIEVDLRRFVPLIRQLGPNGMSSDESGVENNVVKYRICKRHWRSQMVSTWLRQIDGVCRSLRITSAGTPAPGRWAHPRVEGDKTSMRPPIRCLPKECYNRDWLSRLEPWRLKKLDPRDEVCDLTHTQDVLDVAAHWSEVTTRRAANDLFLS